MHGDFAADGDSGESENKVMSNHHIWPRYHGTWSRRTLCTAYPDVCVDVAVVLALSLLCLDRSGGDLPDRRSHGIPALIRQSGTVWVWVPQEGRITNLYITKLS